MSNFNTKLIRWNIRTASNECPESRSGHTVVTFQNCLYLFGGADGENEIIRDGYVHKFDFTRNVWSVIPPSNGIYGRINHSAVVMNDSMMIFGGEDDEGRALNELWSFDLIENKWRNVSCRVSPKSRSKHSAVVMSSGCMLVFGGKDEKTVYNDVLLYQLKTSKWSRWETHGEIPSARYSHSAVIHAEKMYIFGGVCSKPTDPKFYCLDIKSSTWSSIKIDGAPSIDFHTAVVNRNSIIVFDTRTGGFQANEFFIPTMKWRKMDYIGSIPGIRTGHAALIRGNTILVIGGYSNSTKEVYPCVIYEGKITPAPWPCLHDLLEEKMFLDMKIQTNDQIFYAHKTIFSQSKELSELLKSGKVDQQTGLIEVTIDVLGAVFQQVLNYLYGHTFILSANCIAGLFKFAISFGLHDLADGCLAVIPKVVTRPKAEQENFRSVGSRIVNEEKLFAILQEAHKHNLKELKQRCFDIICKHRQVLQSPIISKLEHDLMVEVLQLISHPSSREELRKESSYVYLQRLSKHISYLWESKEFSDSTVISNDGRKFITHKLILCSELEFFKAMICNQFKEFEQSEIKLDDVDGSTLEIILKYVYTRHVVLPDDISSLVQLIRACDFMMHHHLYTLAVEKLLSKTTVKDITKAYQFCCEYGLKDLGLRLLEQMSRSQITTVISQSLEKLGEMNAEIRTTRLQMKQMEESSKKLTEDITRIVNEAMEKFEKRITESVEKKIEEKMEELKIIIQDSKKRKTCDDSQNINKRQKLNLEPSNSYR